MIYVQEIGSPLGRLIAACTEKNLCLLEWSEQGLAQHIQRLEKQYDLRIKIGSHLILRDTERALKGYFKRSIKRFDIPLKAEGTEFQQKVWKELKKIPYGRTISYGDLAKKMGIEGGARAVGAANGRNPISILVPCHRVVEGSGKLRGYRGEVWRKAWLLDLEQNRLLFKPE